MDLGGVLELKKPGRRSTALVYVLDDVSLDRPPLGETFWSLLGGEGGRPRGLMRGPGSP